MKIRNAIISVSDKEGIVSFANRLSEIGISIFSTGQTFQKLKENNIKVRSIDHLTGMKEMLDGRVRTLHPHIHGGILYRRDDPSHQTTIEQASIETIDLVVVSLYPFEQVTQSDPENLDQAIENIDIGGVSLIRAAAKNHRWVTVICDQADFDPVLEEIKEHQTTTLTTRKRLAAKAFETTMLYDTHISSYLNRTLLQEEQITHHFKKIKKLRYGENPHQSADLYQRLGAKTHALNLPQSVLLHGKQMSYNNYLDAESGLRTCGDFSLSTAVVIKHQTPCGIATGDSVEQALKMAWEGDIVSSFGSVIAVNRCFSLPAAQFLKDKFIEIIIAPDFTEEALEFLKQKNKHLRILQTPTREIDRTKKDIHERYLSGGLLTQESDHRVFDHLDLVSPHKRDLDSNHLNRDHYYFAFSSVKNIKSNAIAITHEYQPKKYMLIGTGSGQPNRVDSVVKLALPKMRENLSRLYPDQDQEPLIAQLILASDAFFPFSDNIDFAYKSGIRKIIQPGGSVRDQEVIEQAKKYGMEMVLTHTRHFLH